jgi:hypothetical protein
MKRATVCSDARLEAIDSRFVNDDADVVMLWLRLDDGSLIGYGVQLAEVLLRGHLLEASTHAPRHAAAH